MSQAGSFMMGGGGGGGTVSSLTGNDAVGVGPDGGGEIYVLGSGGITTTGDAATNTITITDTGSITTISTDSGDATPISNEYEIVGGNNIATSGATNVVTINVSGTTNHAVQVGSAAGALNSIAVGTTNTVLLGNTGADPSFGQVPNGALANDSVTLNNGNNITVTGGTPLVLGGTASFDVTGTTNHSLLLGNATGSINSLGVAGNGFLPIGSVGADPVLAQLTAGTNITITNAPGSITIASTGGGSAFPWTEITVVGPTGMAVNNGYIANNVAQVGLTLPAVAAQGTIIEVVGKGTGGWLIAQNAGQTIYYGIAATTTGVTGSLSSFQYRNGVRMLCITANTEFQVISSQGNIIVT